MKEPYWPQTCASDEKFDMVADNGSAEWINEDAAAADAAAAGTKNIIMM